MTTFQLSIVLIILAVIRSLLKYGKNISLREGLKEQLIETFDGVIVAGLGALALIMFVVRTFYVPTHSMEPTLQTLDYLIVNEMVYHFKHPQRGDIIVFHPMPVAGENDGKNFIKRVIALSGETIEVREGKVYINGAPLKEPYIAAPPEYQLPKITVPAGNIFVLGDNRNRSDDSHSWGPLPMRNIVGKAFGIFWPPARMRIFRAEPL